MKYFLIPAAILTGVLVASCQKESTLPASNAAPSAAPSGAPSAVSASAPPTAAESSAAALANQRWAHSGSDLKPDGKLTFGALPNGFRYVLRPHAEPPARLALQLYIDAGSLMETDPQRGLAHFLEHMAFNGTKNFAAGQMVEYFQKRGLGFGAHTNAHTSFRETVYKLEVPSQPDKSAPDAQTLGDCFKVMRDVADGMLLAPAEIDRERGVILSEKLARDTVDFRTFQEGFRFQMPDSLIPKRMPIGLEETISGAPQKEFAEFYKKWYTPDRMVLVIVGQLDVKEMAQQVAATFGSLSGTRVPDPEFGSVSQGMGIRTKFHVEQESGHATISFSNHRAWKQSADNTARRLVDLRRELACRIMGRRLELLAEKEGAVILQGQADISENFRLLESVELELIAPPEHWHDAVALGAQELKKARQFGFTQSEVNEAKATMLTEAETAANGSLTRDAKEVAMEMVSLIAADRVMTDPVDDLARLKAVLPTVTKEHVSETYQLAWASKDLNVFASGKLPPPKTGETLELALNRGMAAPVTAPEEKAELTFGYTDFGPVGTVSSKTELADVGLTQVAFANGVRLTLKKTDFKKNEVLVQVSTAGGRLAVPPSKTGLDTYCGFVFDAGGLGKHSVDDLKSLLAAVTASSNLSIDEDTISLVGETTSRDLKTQLQLLAAFVTDPGWRPEADRQLRQAADALYSKLDHTPEGIQRSRAEPWFRGGDPRFAYPDKETLLKRTPAEAKEWLEPKLKTGPLEIAIVGDIDIDASIQLAAATFGAIPLRPASASSPQQPLAPPAPGSKEFTFESMIPKALLSIGWPTRDRYTDVKKARHLQLLAAVLSDRLRVEIREKLGDSYSPRAQAQFSDVIPSYGWMMTSITCSAAQVPKAADVVINKIATSLCTSGVTDEELDRTKRPMLTALEEQRRTNAYWLTMVCARAQSHPYRIDWARSLMSDFSTATKADLDPLCRLYLSPAQARQVWVRPVSPQNQEIRPLEAPASK